MGEASRRKRLLERASNWSPSWVTHETERLLRDAAGLNGGHAIDPRQLALDVEGHSRARELYLERLEVVALELKGEALAELKGKSIPKVETPAA